MSLSGPRTVKSDLELMSWNHLGLAMRHRHDSKLITCARTRCCMTYVTGIIRLFAWETRLCIAFSFAGSLNHKPAQEA
jgi:hypothetical protein